MPRASEQPDLLPPERVQAQLQQVETRLLDYTLTQEPDGDFVQSILQVGVLTPILVRPFRNRFKVIAGRRRAEAAVRIGLRTIPAMVIEGSSQTVLAGLSVTENAHRAPNPLGDVQAIEVMLSAGAGPLQIAEELGISLSLVRQRMRLAALVDTLRDRVAEGTLSIHLAERLSRLTQERQIMFAEQNRDARRITAAHIREFQGETLRAGPLGNFSEDTDEMFSPAEMGGATVVGQGLANGQAYDIILWRNEQWVPLNLAANHLIDRIEHQGWGGVLALLTEVDRIMPVEPNDDSDAFFNAMEEMRTRVARRLAARPSAPLVQSNATMPASNSATMP